MGRQNGDMEVQRGIEAAGSPTELEAVAIVAAIQRFLSDTAPPAPRASGRDSGWLRAARLEAVGLDATANPHFLKL